jgi:hypothetical protein
MILAIRPLKNVKGAYEAKVEYMPGYVKTFIGKNFKWILEEIEKAAENKVPTLSGPVKTIERQN